jgi:hypothetical protein
MALTRSDDIQVHQENDDPNNNNVDVPVDNTDRDDTTAMGTAAASGAVGGNGTNNFNLQMEQNKILEFFVTKSKDTISAMDFILQLENLAKTK